MPSPIFPKSRLSTMVKSLILTVSILSIFSTQGICSDITKVVAKNTFYFQLAREGNYKSANFRHVFLQGRKYNYSYSIGYSRAGADFAVPLYFNVTTKGKAHHLEASFGVIPYVELVYAKIIDSDKQVYIASSIGYTYQENTRGLFLKVAVGPQLFVDPPSNNVLACTASFIKPSASLALGFSF